MIKPIKDNVVIKKDDFETKTKSGIVLPDSAKEKSQTGEIVAIGTGKTLENGEIKELEVKVGDRVYFSKYSGTEININDKEYLIISENDILAIIEAD